jgi:hypothetical protein
MNNRQFQRVEFAIDAQIQHQGQIWPCQLLNVSLNGLLLERPNQFDADEGEQLTVTFTLEGLDTPITLVGQLAHSHNNYLGVELTTLDIDSFTEVRRLISLNVGDGHNQASELQALIDES